MAKSRKRKSAFKVGDSVEIQWEGSWFPGQVLEVLSDGVFKIHYSGFDSSWDEVVTPARLRAPGAVAAKSGDGSQSTISSPSQTAGGAVSQPVSFDPIKQLLLGEQVTAKTPLEPGDAVLADWGGTYWEARVLDLQKKNVKITYVGWDSSWNETVPRSRLRLRHHDVKTLRVFFDRDWIVEGEFIESAGGLSPWSGPRTSSPSW
jgi:hypothetical protein